jgi:hypothetical protein
VSAASDQLSLVSGVPELIFDKTTVIPDSNTTDSIPPTQ